MRLETIDKRLHRKLFEKLFYLISIEIEDAEDKIIFHVKIKDLMYQDCDYIVNVNIFKKTLRHNHNIEVLSGERHKFYKRHIYIAKEINKFLINEYMESI